MAKTTRWQVVVFIALEAIILGISFFVGLWMKEEKRIAAVSEKKIENDYTLLFDIEGVEEKGENILFYGWTVYPDAQNKEIALVLKAEDNEEHILFADLTEKKGITDSFLLSENFGNQGFEASIRKTKLDTNSCHEIFISVLFETEKNGETVESRKKIATCMYYYDGNIYCYNPKEFKKPNVISEELIRVVEEGTVRAYDSVEGIWVYQYDTKLFCLIDSNKNRICEETKLDVPVMVLTSCEELLPENRQQYGNDHLGAYYANEKYAKENKEVIQVVEVELPTEYPVTYVMTGVYDNTQKQWKKLLAIPMFDWCVYK